MTPRHDNVLSTADLEATWRRLIGPLGFGSRQVFAILIDGHGVMFKHIIHITECPRVPEPVMVSDLADALLSARDIADPHGSCAVFWARPTSAGDRETDLVWVRAMMEALADVGLDRWPIHVADDREMWVVSPDDLVA